MKRVVLIEDDKTTARFIAKVLNNSGFFHLFDISESYEDFIEKKIDTPIDFILLDLLLPGVNGINAIIPLKKKYPDTEIIILTEVDNSDVIFQALKFGATGYLLKKEIMNKLGTHLEILITGGSAISPIIARKIVEYFQPEPNIKLLRYKEQVIIKLLAEGNTYDEVASTLNVKIDTIRYYIKKIYVKLHVDNKVDAINKYKQLYSEVY